MSLADRQKIAKFTHFPLCRWTPRFCHLGIFPFYPFIPVLVCPRHFTVLPLQPEDTP